MAHNANISLPFFSVSFKLIFSVKFVEINTFTSQFVLVSRVFYICDFTSTSNLTSKSIVHIRIMTNEARYLHASRGIPHVVDTTESSRLARGSKAHHPHAVDENLIFVPRLPTTSLPSPSIVCYNRLTD